MFGFKIHGKYKTNSPPPTFQIQFTPLNFWPGTFHELHTTFFWHMETSGVNIIEYNEPVSFSQYNSFALAGAFRLIQKTCNGSFSSMVPFLSTSCLANKYITSF